MPMKPKRPCRYPGCPNLTDGLYCEEHAKVMQQHYEKFHARLLLRQEVRQSMETNP
jgi:hypothetical protein